MKTLWQWFAGEQPAQTDHQTSPLGFAGDVGETASVTIPNRLSLSRLLGLFLLIGFLARAIRYYLCFPLWDDESFLCVNFINRSYAELLNPLDYHQVAPVLFLWAERACVQMFGFSEYALRLVPFVCSLLSLVLFHRVAQRLLSGPGLLFAVAIFAVSYPGIRYGAEAKPYGTDLFLSLGILALVVEWIERRDQRILWGLAALMPLALGASYPAVFTGGGLSLVVGSLLLAQRGSRAEWLSWVGWNVSLVLSFGVWFTLVGKVQSGAEAEFMGEYWKQNFPPVRQPLELPYWMLKTHASDFLAYPLGGPKWASSLTLCLCLAGLWRLVSQRRSVWLGLLLGPASLHFLAAALQKYPYGGHVKFSQYLAPMICCLAAVGIVQLLDLRTRWGYSAKTGFVWGAVILAAVGFGDIARDLVSPYKTRSDERARAFAQAFWPGTHFAEEVVCLKSDWGLDFVPEQHQELSWSAHYYCNRAIEVSRGRLHSGDESRVTVDRPLRCVLYREDRYAFDRSGLENWLQGMQERYELVGRESVPLPRRAKDDRRLVTMEYVDSFRFVPRADSRLSTPLPTADGRLNPAR
ncbi:glycosyltransferase family 39 protein [Schlesneria sp. T3-172]|uniref:glycosyltransferase family 39 protein n=1 Tax=Schlesneria sphaerica TaxID=3373610 RepID=UPI0037CB653A